MTRLENIGDCGLVGNGGLLPRAHHYGMNRDTDD